MFRHTAAPAMIAQGPPVLARTGLAVPEHPRRGTGHTFMGVHPQLAAVERVAAGSSGDMQSVGNHVLGLKPGTPSPPRLDVHFNTDPLFVRAGIDGMAVPRGLSGVESDTSVPVLKFKSDDAYATAAELSRRASAAKEMRAALAAQISAKRMVTSKAFDADDHYEVRILVTTQLSPLHPLHTPTRAPQTPRQLPRPTPAGSPRGVADAGRPGCRVLQPPPAVRLPPALSQRHTSPKLSRQPAADRLLPHSQGAPRALPVAVPPRRGIGELQQPRGSDPGAARRGGAGDPGCAGCPDASGGAPPGPDEPHSHNEFRRDLVI